MKCTCEILHFRNGLWRCKKCGLPDSDYLDLLLHEQHPTGITNKVKLHEHNSSNVIQARNSKNKGRWGVDS